MSKEAGKSKVCTFMHSCLAIGEAEALIEGAQNVVLEGKGGWRKKKRKPVRSASPIAWPRLKSRAL